MTSSKSIVDWNALSLNEGIRFGARLLREQLGVRLFVATSEGDCIDLTPPCGDWETVFDHFAQTDARWSNGDERATMDQTRRLWAKRVAEWQTDDESPAAQSAVVDTAPGFQSRLVPVIDGEQLQGVLVVAGYVPTEGAARRVESIRRFLPDHLSEAIDSDDGPRIVQLPRCDRVWIERVAQSMAEAMSQTLDEEASSLVDGSTRRFAGMLGKSKEMKSLFRKIEKVSRTNSTVLITGENGTGKELVARAIHRLSPRRDEKFIAVNCAAIPADLIASELFGHVKGAFSGAHQERSGLFEAADGGTLLLDEIGDMEQSLQTKLLRVLQEGTLVRVGDTEVRKVDVRVLCATNTDLQKLVRQGRFRRDLYFRIRVIELGVSPLRDRRDDIGLLARHFVKHTVRRHGTCDKELSQECIEQLRRYDWPGNVRELENAIERLVIMSGAETRIDARWLSPPIAEAEEPEPTVDFEGYQLPEAIEWIERKMILEGLLRTGWNKTQTARELGVSRRNLIRKVARYELEEDREDS